MFDALKSIIQEASFSPKIIYHNSYYDRRKAKKHSNEVHCVIFFHPNVEYFIFNLILYDMYHTTDNQTIFFNTEHNDTQTIKIAGSGPLTQEQRAPIVNILITKYLSTDTRSLSNATLISKARYDLENYSFHLANEYFIKSNESNQSTAEKKELIDKALKLCLYLPSSSHGEDFNTNFKRMIAESYFGDIGAYTITKPKTITTVAAPIVEPPITTYTKRKKCCHMRVSH